MGRALEQLQRESQDTENQEAEAAGIATGLNQWRESLPDTRMPDDQVMRSYLDAAEAETLGISGALSVATGDTDDESGTTPPGTGPDGEKTAVGEAGEVSEGGDGPETPENLWQPPLQSKEEDYEEPATDEIVASPEWIENAKRAWKAFGSPNRRRKQGQAGPLGISRSATELTGRDADMTDEEIADWAKKKISGFNWNVANTVSDARTILGSDDPEAAVAFLNLINMYDHSDGGAAEFGRGVYNVLTDPTTYAGIGVGSVASRGAAIATAKAGFKKAAMKLAAGGAAAGATEGAALTGSFDLVKQQIEKDAGARDEIDPWQTTRATLLGGGVGAGLGGGLGFFAGKMSDELSQAVNKHVDDLLEGKDQGLNDPGTLRMGRYHSELISSKYDQSSFAMQIEGAMEQGIKPQTVKARPSEVFAMQRWIDEDFMDDPVFEALEKPVLFEKDGEMFIIDGHHRFHDAAKAGDEPLDAHLFTDEGTRAPEPDEVPGYDVKEEGAPAKDVPLSESEELAARIAETEEITSGKIKLKTPRQQGTTVVDASGSKYEVIGRTKNGWYKVTDLASGEEKNFRRKQFEITADDAAVKPGNRNLSIFTEEAARIIGMADEIANRQGGSARPRTEQSWKTTQAQVERMREMGIDVGERELASNWDVADAKYLMDTFDAQAKGLAILAKRMYAEMRAGGHINDVDLAFFNQAHAKFAATGDLLQGVAGNAARILNIMRSKPSEGVYDFADSVLGSINVQGGRNNTERVIRNIAEAHVKSGKSGKSGTAAVAKTSQKLWNQTVGTWILNVRYNMMLSSWRTHFKNFVGNTASGLYELGLVSPMKMAWNNANYGAQYMKSFIPGVDAPDPATRMTVNTLTSEWRGMMNATRDSLRLAKEIALGRDIGEGKIWNELGLRYNVVNVPKGVFGKLGTTPVRMLEAGDAFFKNQYYQAKIYGLADQKARVDAQQGMDYKERLAHWIDNADPSMDKEARDFAAKLTYTNDPSVYGTVLGNMSRAAQSLQSGSLIFNAIMPFVRTPANLMGYSLEVTGLINVPRFKNMYNTLVNGAPEARQDMMARLTVAAGLWTYIYDLYQSGDITGRGPVNWEEKKAWEAAGWQGNSIKIGGKWVDISDFQPIGSAINQIATIYDSYAINDENWMAETGIALLSLTDSIKDESYLSTITDVIVAIESQSPERINNLGASIVSSYMVPNLLRDIRRATDEKKRSLKTSDVTDNPLEFLIERTRKQIKNAVPGQSGEIAPARDWKGDVKNYYGNAYMRALIPVNVKDPSNQDPASAAIAYSRIPIRNPETRISMPGRGNFVDLMSMDNGRGFVFDKYVEMVGKARHEAVTKLLNSNSWKKLAREDEIGPGSRGDEALRRALAIGGQVGRGRMLNFLIDNDKVTRGNGEIIQINHPFDKDEYRNYLRTIQREGINVPEGDINPAYDIRQKKQGPEFFSPN